MEGLALLLDVLHRLELVALVLAEQCTFRANFLHIHQAHHLERLLVDQTQLLLNFGRRPRPARLQQLPLLRVRATIPSQLFLNRRLQLARGYNFVDDLLLRLVAAGVLLLLNVGDFEGLLFGGAAMLLDFDELDERDILGKLRDIVGFEVDHDIVLWALQPVLAVLLDEQRVEAALAVGVPAGRQQARHVVAAVLAVTEGTLEVALHN